MTEGMLIEFKEIVRSIVDIHHVLGLQAARAVNLSLTLRNWMIGYYIDTFEMQGADRAEYGNQLFAKLADELTRAKLSNCDKRQLYRYLRLYRSYPAIVGMLSPQLQVLLFAGHKPLKVETPSPQLSLPVEKLVSKLSYSHLELLVEQDDESKRHFYEMECIQGNWTVRELKRQIHSLYFERCGLSTDKQKLAELTRQGTEQQTPTLTVRDPYVFEFLGLTPKEVMNESYLEEQLISKIEEFLLELGHGFCFEARQKRILIGDEYYFIDLVFYHRILKCHILVELKLAEFNHENIGQLNTYVSWYRKNLMLENDNPPIGLLLCTHKQHSLVEYALAGMDNQLFVSKYQLELPKPEDIERFLAEKLKEVEADDE